MLEYGYSSDIIKKVMDVILSHSCENLIPTTLEGKILANADAMAHYSNNFYLQIAVLGQRSLEELKIWALEKLARDYNKRMFFPFAKKEIKKKHDILMQLFTMK
jgi:hypothetical protein